MIGLGLWVIGALFSLIGIAFAAWLIFMVVCGVIIVACNIITGLLSLFDASK